MLKELNDESDYWKYMLGSQFTHISPIATGLYRIDKGTEKGFSEFVEPGNWFTCFDMMWPFFERAARLFLERYGANPELFFTQQQSDELRRAMEAIK